LSEQHRIGQYADDHAVLLVPHGWNTAVGLATDLQLVAAAGNARWVEYITPSPYVEDLFLEPLRLDDAGRLAIPDAPGLGFVWNPEGIAKHTRGMSLSSSTRL
jgi:L-alanine-DL-glutamate epimerase-like enolase superfamily enzyme